MAASCVNVIDLETLKVTTFSKLRLIDVKQTLKHHGQHFKSSLRKRDLVDMLTGILMIDEQNATNTPAAVKIQAAYRGHRVRRLLKLHGPAVFLRSLCNNDVDPVTLEDVDKIPYNSFFSFRDDVDQKVYGFNITSINELVNREAAPANPFNRRPITEETIALVRSAAETAPSSSNSVVVVSTRKPTKKAEKMDVARKAFEVFHNIFLASGCFTDEQWFLVLTRRHLIAMYQTIHSLVQHQVYTQEPSEASKFLDLNNLPFNDYLGVCQRQIYNTVKLQMIVLTQCEMLLKYPAPSNQSTPAMWVLLGLTQVSGEAAHHLPIG